jgi:hypothetical protein
MEQNALSGFVWTKGANVLGLLEQQMWCVRNALSGMFGWKRGSVEWQSIPPGPPGTDLERLCNEKPELGIIFHGFDEHIDGAQPGIVLGNVMTPRGVSGHSAYAPRIGDIAGDFDQGISGVITWR